MTALMSGAVDFSGGDLIGEENLKALIGGSTVTEENWLTNFVIYDYLNVIASSCIDRQIQVLSREHFEKSDVKRLAP